MLLLLAFASQLREPAEHGGATYFPRLAIHEIERHHDFVRIPSRSTREGMSILIVFRRGRRETPAPEAGYEHRSEFPGAGFSLLRLGEVTLEPCGCAHHCGDLIAPGLRPRSGNTAPCASGRSAQRHVRRSMMMVRRRGALRIAAKMPILRCLCLAQDRGLIEMSLKMGLPDFTL